MSTPNWGRDRVAERQAQCNELAKLVVSNMDKGELIGYAEQLLSASYIRDRVLYNIVYNIFHYDYSTEWQLEGNQQLLNTWYQTRLVGGYDG